MPEDFRMPVGVLPCSGESPSPARSLFRVLEEAFRAEEGCPRYHAQNSPRRDNAPPAIRELSVITVTGRVGAALCGRPNICDDLMALKPREMEHR